MNYYAWAQDYPEIYKICNLFDLRELQNPVKYAYKSLPTYIQDGPQCGLVALAIALNRPTSDFVDSLLNLAKSKNYTNNGEIFSAENLAELCKEFLPPNKVHLHSSSLRDNKLENELFSNGKLLLVPYDSDKDNSPCLEQGKKAHWAVICGAVQSETDELYVLARHGKARNVAVWKWDNLALSNAQLVEVGPLRKLPDANYIIPDGGIGGDCGLRNKAVILTVE